MSGKYVQAKTLELGGELFAFLTIYKEFGESLVKLHGEDALIDSNFKDEEVEELISKFKYVDAKALENNETFSANVSVSLTFFPAPTTFVIQLFHIPPLVRAFSSYPH